MYATILSLSQLSFGQSPFDELKILAKYAYPSQTLVVRQKTVTYRSYIRDDAHVPAEGLQRAIQVASELSLDYIHEHYRESCDTKDTLEVFEVSFEELNVPGYIVSADQKGFGSIWGYYDPRRTKTGIDAIFATFHTAETTHIIYAHEVAHYWYERLCVAFDWKSSTSEEFAKKMEELYTQRYLASR